MLAQEPFPALESAMDKKPAPSPHFAGPKPGEHFAVAPGMRFRKPSGTVAIVPPPKN